MSFRAQVHLIMGANCVASTSIGCLFCIKGCSAEKVRNAFTFIPPIPSYAVQTDDEDSSRGRMMYAMTELSVNQLYCSAKAASEIRFVTTSRGSRIPIVWLRAERDEASSSVSSKPWPIVLLHCHGNATDIGMMMGPYFELSRVLGIEVVGVEYSGYGSSSGKPSASNTYADLEAAYDFLIKEGVPAKRIVAYGQSVGSGPASSLAARKPLGGVILHSPLLSGIKVVDPLPDRCCRPSCIWHCFDFFPNDVSVKHVTCPVFIMHGQRDDIIPFYHGYRLHKAIPPPLRWPPYFPAVAGHNDLMESDMRSYFGEISSFLHDVKKLGDGTAIPGPKATIEMSTYVFEGRKLKTEVDGHGPASDFNGQALLGSIPEPPAGPRDDRYELLRQGKALQAVGSGP